MIWLVLGSMVPSFLISLTAAFFVRRFAIRLKLIDQPSDRGVHSTATPMGGGIAIWLGVMLPFMVGLILLHTLSGGSLQSFSGTAWQSLAEFVEPHLPGLMQQSGKLGMLLAGGTAMMLLGLMDDRLNLDWRLRISLQFLVAALMVSAGWRLSLFIEMPWITSVLSVIWIVGLINSFNMLDNMDGLSAGVASIAATMLAVVILLAPDPITLGPQLFVGGFLLVLVGALLGFLWHNRPPARLFMGDAGSYFVGFSLATATISATFAGGSLPQHAILAPLCVLAVPIYDTVTVIWIRLREGRSPFEGDRNHISHRLVEIGLSKSQAVLVIYAATALCGVGAFFLHRVDWRGSLLIFLLTAGLLFLLAVFDLKSRRNRHQKPQDS